LSDIEVMLGPVFTTLVRGLEEANGAAIFDGLICGGDLFALISATSRFSSEKIFVFYYLHLSKSTAYQNTRIF
jgi:hypothetical protein